MVAGDRFVVQWKKHYLDDPRSRQEFQASLYPDGTVRFLYEYLDERLLDLAGDRGYPVLVGLQDGFAAPDGDGGRVAYLYKGAGVDPADLVSDFAMVELRPAPGGCSGGGGAAAAADEGACGRLGGGKCHWCGASGCVYGVEIYRPGSDCSTGGTADKKKISEGTMAIGTILLG